MNAHASATTSLPVAHTSTARMPVLFVGHGSPMNAIEDNPWSRAWTGVGQTLPTPRAILCISAHWFVRGTFVTGNPAPETIHDFGAFPKALFEVDYPARGDAELAKQISDLLAHEDAHVRNDWGLDHGTWSVLKHLRPAADVPVLQLSIDSRQAPNVHRAIGCALAPLRDQGVLIVGSGNVTHNLRDAMVSQGKATPAWASAFDLGVKNAVEQHDNAYLERILETAEGRMAHPSPDHYLPLLYAVGAASEEDSIEFPVSGFDYTSLSMRSIVFG